MDIGNKIKQLRVKCRMTQESLANILNISAQSVSKWENGVTMPDITLLPSISGALGVTLDELFDLSTEQKLEHIERRLDIEEDFTDEIFSGYEAFLKDQADAHQDKGRIFSLLAHLYHHRMESDARRVSKYARSAIMLSPEKKECQWLLQKAEGAACWDWNISNHTGVIDFYKSVIENDTASPGSHIPYYEIIDNLLADHRTREAREYFEIYKVLPGCKPFLVPVYEAYISLAEYDEKRADGIMEKALCEFGDNSGFLFESAQYHARKCNYEKALQFYEASFAADENKKPRYTDALDGIATVYEILGDKENAIRTYDRMIACIKDEWGYSEDDAAVIEVERRKRKLYK